jgi:hypothetical protein
MQCCYGYDHTSELGCKQALQTKTTYPWRFIPYRVLDRQTTGNFYVFEHFRNSLMLQVNSHTFRKSDM